MPEPHLTILLTLKDRVAFTERWLAYAALARLPARILIADGGMDDAAAPIVAAYQERQLEVERVRYPADRSYADYYAKVADALSRITTPLVVLADNDDLLIPDGLAAAARFLIDHPAYVACAGHCAVFWVAGDAVTGNALYGDVSWKYRSLLRSDTATTASRRVLDQSMGASDVFYAVHRTALLRRHFDAVRQCNPSDLYLMEQLVAFLTAIAGPGHQLDTLYLARQLDSPGSSGEAHRVRYGGWFDRMLVPSWSADLTRVVDAAAAALAEADGIPLDLARSQILVSYKAAVAPALLNDVLAEPSVSPAMPMVQYAVRRLVARPAGSALRRLATRFYRGARWLSDEAVTGTAWRATPVAGADAAFGPVRAFLRGPHPGRHR